jgi:acyl carrier protein
MALEQGEAHVGHRQRHPLDEAGQPHRGAILAQVHGPQAEPAVGVAALADAVDVALGVIGRVHAAIAHEPQPRRVVHEFEDERVIGVHQLAQAQPLGLVGQHRARAIHRAHLSAHGVLSRSGRAPDAPATFRQHTPLPVLSPARPFLYSRAMFARSRQLYATGMFVIDAALIAGAWLAAYALRFHALGLPTPLGVPPLTQYLWFGAVLTPIALLVLRTFRLYRSARTGRLGAELLAIAQAMVVVAGFAAIGSFYARGELSRTVIMIFLVVATFALASVRIAARLVLRALRRSGHNLRHVLVVGTGEPARMLLHKIRRHDDFGFQVHGLIAARAEDVGRTIEGVPVLGLVADLPRLTEEHGAELIYVALERREWEAEAEALTLLADSTAAVRLVPDLTQAFRLNPSVEDFDGMPVVLVTESPEQGWGAVVKRTFDLVASGSACC